MSLNLPRHHLFLRGLSASITFLSVRYSSQPVLTYALFHGNKR